MLKQYYEPKKAAGGSIEDAEEALASPGYYAQEKLDGHRLIVQIDEDGTARAYTRVVGKHSKVPGDKTGKLQHILDECKKLYPKGTVLDGEVLLPVGPGIPLSKSHLVATAIADPGVYGLVQYGIFDVIAYGGRELIDETAEVRASYIQEGEEHTFAVRNVWLPSAKKKFLETIWANGGEGIILKDKNSPYDSKRNKMWIKVKQVREYDVVFMGVEAAKEKSLKKGAIAETDTKYKGLAGAIVFGQYVVTPVLADDLQLLGCETTLTKLGTVSGFTDEQREDITANAEKYTREQRVFTVRSQERTETGALRHPRFVCWRDDKDAFDCVLRMDES